MGAPEIRELRRDDMQPWAGLWRAYLDFYETTLPEAVYQHTFERLSSDDPAAPRGLLAIAGGRPVGLVHYIFHPHCWKPEGVCYLQDLYVHPDARGTGLGRALIEAVYAAADARNVPGVYWMTQDFNHTARALYDRIAVKTPFIKYQRR